MSRLLSTTLRSQLSKRLATSAVKPSNALRASLPKIAATTSLRLFHNSSMQLNQAEATTLRQLLEGEKQILEKIPNDFQPEVSEVLSSLGFTLVSKPGNSTVELVKKDEKGQIIHVYFDVEEVSDFDVLEEGEIAEDAEPEGFDQSFSVVRVLVENQEKNQGLLFDLFLGNAEPSFVTEAVSFQSDVSKLIARINESNDFVDKFAYEGPKFGDLEEEIQVGFEQYLDANGVNPQLAEFIVSYSEFKEEQEYRGWLDSIITFLK
ncbi:MAM33 Mitochondrial acidic protein MAM33 [Candida maltosa Xu316]|uniref:Mitochondrial matrix acidic protein, putative n=1 Tax=Candida maltosa (strain Xu316) TaxID=1245528 RepID=M3HJR5_CANMX|nr:Mitochondrial matrix acidic protein, putative [Candida maltosa Xu316]